VREPSVREASVREASVSVEGRRGGWSRRKLALAGVGGVAVALAVGSVAFACTPIIGNTWFSDGSLAKSGSTGTAITAYASGVRAQKPFKLVAGTSTSPGHETHACMDVPEPINAATRMSNLRGFIPYTSGAVNRVPGEWQICFAETPLDGSMPASNPVTLTII